MYGPGHNGSDTKPQGPENEEVCFGTEIGEWICEKLYPWIMRGIGYCLGKMLLGLLFGLGFWLARAITVYVPAALVYLAL